MVCANNEDEGEEEHTPEQTPVSKRLLEQNENQVYGKIEDFLIVNQKKIDLGGTLPGQVKEEDLQIQYRDVRALGVSL